MLYRLKSYSTAYTRCRISSNSGSALSAIIKKLETIPWRCTTKFALSCNCFSSHICWSLNCLLSPSTTCRRCDCLSNSVVAWWSWAVKSSLLSFSWLITVVKLSSGVESYRWLSILKKEIEQLKSSIHTGVKAPKEEWHVPVFIASNVLPTSSISKR